MHVSTRRNTSTKRRGKPPQAPNAFGWTGEDIIVTNPFEMTAIHQITGTRPHFIAKNPNLDAIMHELRTCTRNPLTTLITDTTTPETVIEEARRLGMRIIDKHAAFGPDPEDIAITAYYLEQGNAREDALARLLPPPAPTRNTILRADKLTPMTFGPGVYCIRSPQGTGKTHMISTLAAVDATKPIISISHLISLVRHMGNKLALRQYDDDWVELTDEVEIDAYGKPTRNEKPITRLSTTVHSLHKIIRDNRVMKYHTVIIDEVEQVIRSLTRDMRNKRMIINVLKYLIKNAERVILMDADLDTLTMQTIKRWRPNTTPTIITNIPPNTQKRPLEVLEDINDPYRIITNSLTRKERIYVYSNSRTTTNNVEAFIRTNAPHARTLLINSETNREPEVQAYLNNRNLTQYDAIIASPAVTTGFSIDDPDITRVIGIIMPNINTATDTIQAINRPRHAKSIHLYITPQRANHPTDAESIRRKWTHSTRTERDLAGIDMDTGEVGIQDDDYEFIYVNTKRIENPQLNDLRGSIKKLAAKHFIITTTPKNPDLTDKPARDARKQLKHNRAVTIANTRIINRSTYHQLREAPERTREQTNMVTKYETAEAFGLLHTLKTEPERANKLLTEWTTEGPNLRTIDKLIITLADPKNLWRNMTRSEALRPDTKRIILQQRLHQHALNAAGLTQDIIRTFIHEHHLTQLPTYTKDTPQMTAFIEFVNENYLTLKSSMLIPHLKLLHEMPIRFLGCILRQLGLKQHRVGRNEAGRYTLHRETTERTLLMLTHRIEVTQPDWNTTEDHETHDDDVITYEHEIYSEVMVA